MMPIGRRDALEAYLLSEGWERRNCTFIDPLGGAQCFVSVVAGELQVALWLERRTTTVVWRHGSPQHLIAALLDGLVLRLNAEEKEDNE